jgi:hypothetical protein
VEQFLAVELRRLELEMGKTPSPTPLLNKLVGRPPDLEVTARGWVELRLPNVSRDPLGDPKRKV